MDSTLLLLCLCLGVIAFLYSSVGHAGASGYIAVLTLFHFGPAEIKPIALVLNIFVATITSFQFWRAGHFSWRLFWPFAVLAVPAAYTGGYLHLQTHLLKMLLGVVLLFSAIRLFIRKSDPLEVSPPNKGVAVACGAGIGFLSGLTGTGGGIFLTPLLLFRRWATTRNAAAVSALFILLNSISGLTGFLMTGRTIPGITWGLCVAAILGGAVGSFCGSRRLPVPAIRLLLATVLVIAGIKLLFTR